VRQLNQAGRDSAAAQLFLSRKRVELEDAVTRGGADDRAVLTRTRRAFHVLHESKADKTGHRQKSAHDDHPVWVL